jgi:hypothetical protein
MEAVSMTPLLALALFVALWAGVGLLVAYAVGAIIRQGDDLDRPENVGADDWRRISRRRP